MPAYKILTVNAFVNTIVVVAITWAHPAAAAIVYVIVWFPGVLVLGVIAPVVALIVNPAVPL